MIWRSLLWGLLAGCGVMGWMGFCHAGEPEWRFLVVTDVHFDPLRQCPDAATVARLAEGTPADWPEILETFQSRSLIQVGSDSPWPLLREALADAATNVSRADFVLCAGDLLAHNWGDKYQQCTGRDPSTDPQFEQFTTRTIEFLASQFQKHFGEIPVFPVLGNNDSFCGDYRIAPSGGFTGVFAATFAPLLKATQSDGQRFLETARRGGYYSLPLAGHRRLISLNSVFFSAEYQKCSPQVDMPAGALDELRFFERELEQARGRGERVWLLMHIPPGVDGYATGKRTDDQVVTLWQAGLPTDYTERFLEIVSAHRPTLEVAFAGHSHMNDFRLITPGTDDSSVPENIQESDQSPLVLKISPAISPLFGNNPAYEVFTLSPKGELHFTTRYLPLPSDKSAPPLDWSVAPDLLGMSPLNAGRIAAIAREIVPRAETVGRDYMRQYFVFSDSAPPADPVFLDDVACAMRAVRIPGYRRCCPAPSAKPAPRKPGLSPRSQ